MAGVKAATPLPSRVRQSIKKGQGQSVIFPGLISVESSLECLALLVWCLEKCWACETLVLLTPMVLYQNKWRKNIEEELADARSPANWQIIQSSICFNGTHPLPSENQHLITYDIYISREL